MLSNSVSCDRSVFGWLSQQMRTVGGLSEWQPYRPEDGMRVDFDADMGDGFAELLKLSDDLSVMIVNCAYRSARQMEMIDGVLKLRFIVSGQTTLLNPADSAISLAGPTASVITHPDHMPLDMLAGEQDRHTAVVLYCRPGAFTETMGLDLSDIPELVLNFMEERPSKFAIKNYALPPRAVQAVMELVNSPYNGSLRRLHINAMVCDLTCRILDTISTEANNPRPALPLRRRDIERLHEAREILLECYADSPTIPQLARMVALNEFKLKNGFRQLFGVPVFEFAKILRMERALELLRENDLTITQIAAEVGYEYPSSFTIAFKNHFGMTPKQLRKRPDA